MFILLVSAFMLGTLVGVLIVSLLMVSKGRPEGQDTAGGCSRPGFMTR